MVKDIFFEYFPVFVFHRYNMFDGERDGCLFFFISKNGVGKPTHGV